MQPSDWSTLSIRRDESISPRRQIACRIAALIRDGGLAPGTELPAAARLARHAGVHRNTANAAYRSLSRLGLIETRRGCSAVVQAETCDDPDAAPFDPAVSDLSGFLAAARDRGESTFELGTRFASWMAGIRSGRGSLIHSHRDLGPLIRAEVTRHTGFSIELVTPARALADPDALEPGPVFARPTVVRRLAAAGAVSWVHLVPLRLAGGGEVLGTLELIEPPAVMAVISVSRAVRAYAAALLAGAAAPEIGVLTLAPTDGRRLERAVRIADIAWVDALSAGTWKKAAGRRGVLTRRFHVLSADTRRVLGSWFDRAVGFDHESTDRQGHRAR